MDDQSKLKAISEKLQHQRYRKSTTIIDEKKPLEKILFIVEGLVSIRKKFCPTSWELSAGEIYGEELLRSLDNLPEAKESVTAKTDVEVLFIKADDLNTVLHGVNLDDSIEIPTYEKHLLPMLKNVSYCLLLLRKYI